MSRFFAFGCSFTRYGYPTWADLISDQFDYYSNWGRVGAGNHYIFNSLIECHQQNDITIDDTVVICWSSTGREDRYTTQWIGDGNIYTQEVYDNTWVKQFVTERGCIIRDFAFIKAAHLILQSIGCKFEFLSTVPLFHHNECENYSTPGANNRDVYRLYKDVLNIIKPSFYQSIFDNQWPVSSERDPHPTPNEHVRYIEKETEFKVSDSMKQLAEKETARFLKRRGTGWQTNIPNRL